SGAGSESHVAVAMAPEPAPVAVGRTWAVTFTPSPDLIVRGIKIDTIRARLADIGRIERVTPRITAEGGISFEFLVFTDDEPTLASWHDDGVAYEAVPAPAEPAPTADAPRPLDSTPATANFVRVDLARLDDLMRLVGDLVVSRARLEDTLQRVEPFVP